MANFNAVARTNYFRVRDVEAFCADLERHGVTAFDWSGAQMGAEFIIDTDEKNEPAGSIALFSYGPWPTLDEETLHATLEPGQACPQFSGNEPLECDVCEEPRSEHPKDGKHYQSVDELVAAHLVKGDVAVFMEVGFEKMRFLSGIAVAVNHKNETRALGLDDIYGLAKSLGENITTATF